MFHEVKAMTLFADQCLSWCISVVTCCRTCHTMQVVSLEPEMRWMPQWSVDKQVTMSEREEERKKLTDYYRTFKQSGHSPES